MKSSSSSVLAAAALTCWLAGVVAIRESLSTLDEVDEATLEGRNGESTALVVKDAATSRLISSHVANWEPAAAIKRCAAANMGRVRKALLAPVVFVPITWAVGMLGVASWFGSMVVLAFVVGGQTYEALVTGMALGIQAVIFGTYVATKQASFNLIDAIFGGSQRLKPSCCCPTDTSEGLNGEATCILFSQVTCPGNWLHAPDQCSLPEPDEYTPQTVNQCVCQDTSECVQNKLWKGHTWCHVVESSDCSLFRNWDYCAPATSSVVDGTEVHFNQALSQFEPNLPRRRHLIFRSDSVYKVGGWYVDSDEAVAVGRQALFRQQECFAGILDETLNGCADMCLREGAPTAKTMAGHSGVVRTCVAFAYNRVKKLCVRLPEYAIESDFFPKLKTLHGKGWQNFKRIR